MCIAVHRETRGTHGPSHHLGRPAQEGRVRTVMCAGRPDAVAGAATPDSRLHRATTRATMAARRGIGGAGTPARQGIGVEAPRPLTQAWAATRCRRDALPQ